MSDKANLRSAGKVLYQLLQTATLRHLRFAKCGQEQQNNMIQILFCSLLLILSCKSDKPNLKVDFKVERFLSRNEKVMLKTDSSLLFIYSFNSYENNGSLPMLNEFDSIDVSDWIFVIEGDSVLLGLGPFIKRYWDDTYKLCAFTYYLNNKYNVKYELVDKMYRGCLKLDSTNYTAIFLLAEFRYKHGFVEDSQCLIKYLNDFTNTKYAKLLEKQL